MGMLVARDEGGVLRPGTLVGKYVIQRALGAGGCGTVYAAFDSVLDRIVALKLLDAGVFEAGGRRRSTWSRMVREARMLARLSEPEVVTVYDAGDSDGLPFLAMELVEGGDLKAWIARHRSVDAVEPRPLEDVLALMEQAGRGLAVAHEAGVVHGDFKPANVLIDTRGRAKVSDFGVAKLVNASVTGDPDPAPVETPDAFDETLSVGPWAGTPAYLAPEQFDGRPADVRSDIYAYCTTLFQAVYGKLPFEASSLGELALRKSSGRLQVPRRRDVPRWLTRLIRRGLAVDPSGRPSSMRACIEELAGSRSRTRRTRATLSIGLVGVSVAGLLTFFRDPRSATCEPPTIEWTREARAEVETAFSKVSGEPGRDVAVRVGERLDQLIEQWKDAHIRACRAPWSGSNLGTRAFACLARRRRAIEALIDVWHRPTEQIVEAAALAVETVPPAEACLDLEGLATAPDLPPDPEVREAVEALDADIEAVIIRGRSGAVEEALDLAKRAHQRAEALGYGPLVARSNLSLGQMLELSGNIDGGAQVLQQSFFAAQRWGDRQTAAAAAERLVYLVGTRLEEHEQGLLWVEHARAAANEDGDPSVTLLGNEASVLERLGRYEAAIERYERALELRADGDAYGRGVTLLRLGDVLRAQGRGEEALERYDEASAAWMQALGPHNPRLAIIVMSRATALARLGRNEEAIEAFRSAIDRLATTFGPDYPNLAAAQMNLAISLKNSGRYDEAEVAVAEALRITTAIYGAEHLKSADVREVMGRLLTRAGRPEAALEQHRRAMRIFQAELDPGHPARVIGWMNIADSHQAMGDDDRAIEAYRRAVEQSEYRPEDDPLRGDALAYLGRGLASARRWKEARPLLEAAIERLDGQPGYEDLTASAKYWLARTLWISGSDRGRARTLIREAKDRLSETERLALDQWWSDD